MYLDAVGALYRDAGAGSKSERDEAYKDAMKAVYEKYPDDETRLFYGLSILGTVKEGAQGFAKQSIAARLFEEVYAKNPQHPGVLHYLIHVYDDPEHAVDGLKAARALLGASVCLHLSAPAEVAPLAVAHAVEAAQPAVVRVAPQLPLAAQLLLAARSPLAARLPLAPQLPLAARSPSARLSLAVARPLLALVPPSSAGLRVRLAPAEEVCVQRAAAAVAAAAAAAAALAAEALGFAQPAGGCPQLSALHSWPFPECGRLA